MTSRFEFIGNYTRTEHSHSNVFSPMDIAECSKMLSTSQSKGLSICPRGMGLSFGDMTLNDNESIALCLGMNKILGFDPVSGVINVQAGVTCGQILAETLIQNWCLYSCPGSADVTVAGAVSNNVHGKDSFKYGNFGDHVISLKLLLASGEIRTVTPADSRVFRAVVGGSGLIGMILEVTLQLRKVPSAFLQIETIATRNIHETYQILNESRSEFDFLFSWADCMPTGDMLGRGFVSRANFSNNHAPLSQPDLMQSLQTDRKVANVIPQRWLWELARPFWGRTSVKYANSVKHRMVRSSSGVSERLFTEFIFALNNLVPDPRVIYRPWGHMCFQPMIPRNSGEAGLAAIVRLSQKHGYESLLCGIKLHKADDFYVSFSGDGISVGIDFSLRGKSAKQTGIFRAELERLVLDLGGKFYLAKNENVPTGMFLKMYPKALQFVKVKNELDPAHKFSSNLWRRHYAPLVSQYMPKESIRSASL